MKKILINLILQFKRLRLKRYLVFGDSCKFLKSAKINHLHGATKDSVIIGNNVIVGGTLSVCGQGIIRMGDYSKIGEGSKLLCANEITIGSFSAIGDNTIICDNNNHPVNPKDRLIMRKTPSGSIERSWLFSDSSPIIIGENCWIGSNARICKGVTIGDGSIVAANTVVTKDVPANCIVAGNPGKIVKTNIEETQRYFS
ncbi:MAG: acyltransferase [Bacteroidales bacterium]|nr:acyltransferase [Bacteroidales bacterium]